MAAQERLARVIRTIGWLAVVMVVGLAMCSSSLVWSQEAPATKSEREPGVDPKPRVGRERTFDVRHIQTDLIVDVEASSIRGSVTHSLKPLDSGLKALELDCGSKLNVKKVLLQPGDQPCEFEHNRSEALLRVKLDRAYGPKDTLTVKVIYDGKPTKGLFFIKPRLDDSRPTAPDKKPSTMVWSQGQSEDNREWLPCYDFPNDLATLDMTVTIKKPYFVLSNGVLNETRDNIDETTTYRWKMSQPHVSYLITLVAADFAIYKDKAGDLPVDYYVAKNVDEATARGVLGRTPAMIKFFSEWIGTPYPYPKYSQVCVPNFTNLGMENASATTLADSILIDPTEQLLRNSDDLIAHELAHQWFGDLLTCEDWGHIWLNEGFATYAEVLWDEHVGGPDSMGMTIGSKQNTARFLGAGGRRLVEPDYRNSNQVFDLVAYDKGSCVLHMLRGVVGDRAFREGLQNYVKNNRYKNVVTDDLRIAVEKASGQDLRWFFQQWNEARGVPQLRVSWTRDKKAAETKVQVEQTKATTGTVGFYRLPTTIDVGFANGQRQSIPIVIEPKASQEFVVITKDEPVSIEIDSANWLLKATTQKREKAELLNVFKHATYAPARLKAARELNVSRGQDDVESAFDHAWEKETDHRARAELVRSLKTNRAQQRQSLLKAVTDSNAVVRRDALEILAKAKFDTEIEAVCRRVWTNAQESYDARRTALRTLAENNAADREPLLESALNVKSARDTIANSALTLLLRDRTDRAMASAIEVAKSADRSRTMRRTALQRVGDFCKDHKPSEDALIALIDDSDFSIRAQAWDLLARQNVKRAIEPLQKRLEKEDEANKSRLSRVIKTLTDKESAK